MSILDEQKAKAINPFFKGYNPAVKFPEGTNIPIFVASREMELAIFAAYDYGIEALGLEGREQIQYLINALVDYREPN